MSLHELAHHVQKAGRGEDTVLIHMTPKEVHGLQSLAMAHGGSLTINPETGLPEAGFLSAILPMVAGLALGPAGFALMSAPMAGLAVGAATGLASGSLQKGLMAGLGAFGGASLGTALAGTAGAAGAAGTSAAGTSTLGNIAATPINLSTPFSTLPAAAAATPAASTGYALNGSIMGSAPVAAPASVLRVPTLNAASQITPMSNWDKLAAGTKNALSDPIAFAKANPWQTAGLGLTLANALQPKYNPPKTENQGMIRPYEFSRTQNQVAYNQGNPIYADQPGSSREQNYFTDQYNALTPYAAPGPEYKAEGGLTSLAVGGPVEEMSAQNAVGANQMYPQSQLQTAMYSNPMMQRPVAQNVISSGVDAPVNSYTGEASFASGGTVTPTTGEYKYDYNPQTQQFTQVRAPIAAPTGGIISALFPSGTSERAALGSSGVFSPGTVGGRWDESLRNSPGIFGQLYRKQNPESAQQAKVVQKAPVVTGGIAQAPQAQQPMYQQQAALPAYQSPEQQLGLGGFYNDMNQQLSGMRFAGGGAAGTYNLGDYSDGGRLLRGPGDGVSDSIPASIGDKQPARLADGEFVVPARIVSEIGNGSTEAGARKLYAMMERVQKARTKSIGKGKVAVNSNAHKLLPA